MLSEQRTPSRSKYALAVLWTQAGPAGAPSAVHVLGAARGENLLLKAPTITYAAHGSMSVSRRHLVRRGHAPTRRSSGVDRPAPCSIQPLPPEQSLFAPLGVLVMLLYRRAAADSSSAFSLHRANVYVPEIPQWGTGRASHQM